MYKTLMEIIVSVLAIYGALVFISGIINSIRYRVNRKNPGIKLVLMVKNQEDEIEGIIRSISGGELLEKAMCNGRLTVLDMGSKDETLSILMKLKKSYGYFDIADIDDMEKIFADFQEIEPAVRMQAKTGNE